jgi:hypothetical protein
MEKIKNCLFYLAEYREWESNPTAVFFPSRVMVSMPLQLHHDFCFCR